MSELHKPIASLDSYFGSKRFLKKLDTIRSSTKNIDELKAHAFSIVTQLGLKLEHTNVLYHYLATGEYSKKVKRSPLRVVRGVDLRKRSGDNIDLDENGVFVEISEDTTKEDLLALVTQDWQKIRKALNESYPDRMKRFTETRLIDNYLAIADELNKIEDPHEKALMASELAVKYDKETPEIYTIAKKYRSILVD